MRAPNPWVAVPVLVATIAGAVVGFQVTRISCSPEGCIGAASAIAVLSAIVAFFGVGTVVVLAVRSLAEWQEQPSATRDQEPPGPPTC
jgi:hypothetical protein